MSPEPADLVLAGGGVKGIGHVGVLSVLEEHGYVYRRVAGTSVGAIAGALAAAGMPARRMRAVLRGLDLRTFRDRGGIDWVPIAGKGLSLLFENGIYEGRAVRDWLEEELAGLGVRTFADLKIDDDALPPDEAYRLVVMVADLTRGELVRLPWDYHSRYGLDPDEMPVADAVRASLSIPFFYEPVRLDAATGLRSTLVDGGVLSNFPVDVFDREAPRWPTFGITLIPRLPLGNAHLFPFLGVIRAGPLHLLESLLTTMIVGHDQGQLAKPWIAARTIEVNANHVGVVDFDLSPAEQDELYEIGRDAATRFLAGWSWPDYRKRFR
jgi:NTE family protein